MTQYTDHTPQSNSRTPAERDRVALAGEAAQLPQHLGGVLVAMKTLLSRDPCAHANTAIAMIDEALKLVGGAQPAPVQEPVSVGWQRRLKFPAVPGAVPLWQQCSAQEAMLMFERSPLHEYREVFTAPPAQPADHFAGGGKPIQAAHQCHWRQSDDDSPDTWEGTCGSTKENE